MCGDTMSTTRHSGAQTMLGVVEMPMILEGVRERRALYAPVELCNLGSGDLDKAIFLPIRMRVRTDDSKRMNSETCYS